MYTFYSFYTNHIEIDSQMFLDFICDRGLVLKNNSNGSNLRRKDIVNTLNG